MPPDDSLDGGRHRGKPARTDACRLWLSRSAYAYDSTESRIYSSKLIVSSNSRLRKSLKGRNNRYGGGHHHDIIWGSSVVNSSYPERSYVKMLR
ncbi:O-antigen ligase [Trichinella pseudospiralis]